MKNKYIIGVAAIAVLLVVWGLSRPETITYVAAVNDELALLEAELIDLETKIDNSQLSPEEAVAAQTKLSARLATIRNALPQGNDQTNLNAAQKASFLAGLDKFKSILVSFQGTLARIDVVVETEAKKGSEGSSSKKSLTADVLDTLTAVEDVVEDSVDEYDSTENPINELIDEEEDVDDETGPEDVPVEDEEDVDPSGDSDSPEIPDEDVDPAAEEEITN